MTLAESQSTARGPAAGRSNPRAGSRGGNVRSVEEAGQLQQTHKPTSSERAYAAICAALLKYGRYHRNLLPDLDLPPDDLNCIGSQVSVIKRQGYMVKVGEERNRTVASNARWSPVYEITRLGRERLTAGVAAGSGDRTRKGSPLEAPSVEPSGDPGEQSAPTGVPSPKGSDRSTNPPVPSTSATTGESPAATSPAAGDSARPHETISMLAEPDPEAWAA